MKYQMDRLEGKITIEEKIYYIYYLNKKYETVIISETGGCKDQFYQRYLFDLKTGEFLTYRKWGLTPNWDNLLIGEKVYVAYLDGEHTLYLFDTEKRKVVKAIGHERLLERFGE